MKTILFLHIPAEFTDFFLRTGVIIKYRGCLEDFFSRIHMSYMYIFNSYNFNVKMLISENFE